MYFASDASIKTRTTAPQLLIVMPQTEQNMPLWLKANDPVTILRRLSRAQTRATGSKQKQLKAVQFRFSTHKHKRWRRYTDCSTEVVAIAVLFVICWQKCFLPKASISSERKKKRTNEETPSVYVCVYLQNNKQKPLTSFLWSHVCLDVCMYVCMCRKTATVSTLITASCLKAVLVSAPSLKWI